MFTLEQLRQFANFRSERFPLSTFYWKVPPATTRAHHDEGIQIQNLLREARRKLEHESRGREWTRSLEADQKRILEYFNSQDRRRGGAALFSCAGESFWKAIRLPRGLRSGFFVGETFYLQPLSVALDQYRRYCTVLVDRTLARIFEIYMEEIEEHATFLDDVPGRVKAATWTGGNERQIERRGENKAHQHYKRAAEVVLQFFQKYHFDWLILGGQRDGLAAFENHLHSYLRPRLIGSFSVNVGSVPLQEILAKSLEVAEVRDREEKRSLVQEVLNKANHNGLGVVGLAETLRALELGGVHTLLIDENFLVSTLMCRNCAAAVSVEARVCSLCGSPVERVEDAVEQAVEYAIQDNSQVRYVSGNEEFRQAGSIGALLRFRTVESPA